MFKVKVITLGKLKEKWLEEAISEYEKRLLGKMELGWMILKNEEELVSWAEKNSYIALDPNGELFSSKVFSQKIHQMGLRINFLIGGADGLNPKVLTKAKYTWSLSPLTFTHQMTRLVLIEQLYRALEIEKGTNYHK